MTASVLRESVESAVFVSWSVVTLPSYVTETSRTILLLDNQNRIFSPRTKTVLALSIAVLYRGEEKRENGNQRRISISWKGE